MSDQLEVIGVLQDAGVLAAIRWAYESAARRSLETYSEADGHDAAWLGNTRYVLFRDRLDRVFGCGRYEVPDDDGAVNVDLLCAQLSEHDLATMPRVAPGTVRRADLHGSPGWAREDIRFLLASGEFGNLANVPWGRKGLTKRLVALRPSRPAQQPTLFEELDDVPFLAAEDLARRTYVVAHSMDPFSGEIELFLGSPWLKPGGGGYAWHWHQDLFGLDLSSGAVRDVAA